MAQQRQDEKERGEQKHLLEEYQDQREMRHRTALTDPCAGHTYSQLSGPLAVSETKQKGVERQEQGGTS